MKRGHVSKLCLFSSINRLGVETSQCFGSTSDLPLKLFLLRCQSFAHQLSSCLPQLSFFKLAYIFDWFMSSLHVLHELLKTALFVFYFIVTSLFSVSFPDFLRSFVLYSYIGSFTPFSSLYFLFTFLPHIFSMGVGSAATILQSE